MTIAPLPPGVDTPLLAALRARSLLSPQEEGLMRSPGVLALAPRAQLDYLQSNRRVGAWVTLLAGGLRLALIAGALVAHVVLSASGLMPLGWWTVVVPVALAGVLVWLTPVFLRRVRELNRRLPAYEELCPDVPVRQ
jgi:hypothetical protein